MEAAILIMALLFVAFVALGVYAGVKAVGAARRGVDRTISNARRTVEDTTLRARSLGQAGVPGELAQLRLKLRTSMRATQEALQAGAAEDASLSESIDLFERLSVHARELDDELRQLERDPDRARVAEHREELRERTEQITHAAESLRWAARDRARKFAEDDLSSLSAQIDVESGALRHWTVAEDQPAAEQRRAGEEQRPSGADQRRSGAGRPREQDTDWTEPTSPAEPQAIDPPDSRRRTAYPWQKPARERRPEATN
ncbi:hypothetical protein ACIOJD_08730 [Streptomyces sp. NPDC088116]|uniref:hypothetical protein n=1 Tax=Streptomyces sp. NPDC088116 TaxID=3365825 RepID=UPI00381B331B